MNINVWRLLVFVLIIAVWWLVAVLVGQNFFPTPWQKIVASTNALAESHRQFARNIETDVEAPLRDFAITNREMQGMENVTGNLQALAKETNQKKALSDIISAGEEWLRLYPNYANTPEGCGVRFELANAYLKQAQALTGPLTSNAAANRV